MRSSQLVPAMLLVSGFMSGVTSADLSGVPFSAETRQSSPQGTSSGKMYVGKNRMRIEMDQGGQQVVQIIDNDKQAQLILYPSQHSYMEFQGPGPGSSASPQTPASGGKLDPCAGLQGARCNKLGVESINGRTADKWQMSVTQQGKTMQMTSWIDADRGIPLRTETSEGQRMDLRMLGIENVGGRQVEKWEMSSSAPNQPAQRSTQWYDPVLKLAIREEFPGGFVRELINIREGEPPSSLFSIPAGYQKVTPPASGQQPPVGR